MEAKRVARRKRDTVDRNKVVEEYVYLVNRIAYKMAARLPPNVELDDLKSVGVIGLIDAAEKYESGRGSFKAYAEIRIRGAILDELRSLDWVPRSVRQLGNSLAAARRTLDAELGRSATDAELAEHLGITEEELQAQAARAQAMCVVSYENIGHAGDEGRSFLETVADPNSHDPETCKVDNDRVGVMLRAVQTLPERMRLVLSLYYFEDFNLREIGDLLGVTESRISQLHSAAVDRVRPLMKRMLDGHVS